MYKRRWAWEQSDVFDRQQLYLLRSWLSENDPRVDAIVDALYAEFGLSPLNTLANKGIKGDELYYLSQQVDGDLSRLRQAIESAKFIKR